MAKLTYAQQQRLNRRTADITKLQSQYARSVEDYTASVGTKETAFKAEMDKYNSAYEPYQQKATAYQAKLSEYQKALDVYQKAPMQTLASEVYYGRAPGVSGYMYNNLGDRYSRYNLGFNEFYGQAKAIPKGYEFINTNSAVPYFGDIIGKDVANPGEFKEKFTEVAPTAPAVLDIKAEQTKLQGEKDYTAREIDERSKSRLRAVQRGNSRPMLSSGTNLNKAP